MLPTELNSAQNKPVLGDAAKLRRGDPVTTDASRRLLRKGGRFFVVSKLTRSLLRLRLQLWLAAPKPSQRHLRGFFVLRRMKISLRSILRNRYSASEIFVSKTKRETAPSIYIRYKRSVNCASRAGVSSRCRLCRHHSRKGCEATETPASQEIEKFVNSLLH